MATIHDITTAEQLLHTPDLGRCELVRGELIMMSPAGFEHGRIVSRIDGRLSNFVEQRALGVVAGGEAGFLIAHAPDTVRVPDLAFVRAERVPVMALSGFFPGAPDLAVEVLSPSDRASEVLGKVQDWLSAGCRAVWVIDPATRTVTVHRTSHEAALYTASHELTDEELLPGFRLPVAEIFA